MSIKLFNQGKRVIVGKTPDPTGKTFVDEKDGGQIKPVMVPWSLPPKSALEFTDELGKRLRKMYPRELISLDDVKSQFDAAPAAAAGARIAPKGHEHELLDVSGLKDDEAEAALAAIVAIRAKKEADAAKSAAEEKEKQEPEKKDGFMDRIKTAAGIDLHKEGAEDSGADHTD